MLREDQILDFEEEEIVYEYATTGQRLINRLVDSFIIGLVFTLINGLIPGISDSLRIDLLHTYRLDMSDFIIELFQMLIYYSLFEHLFGQSPGKFITQTKVVTEHSEAPSLGQIIIRSLCRSIPFNALSVLFNNGVGWHDLISKTRVVKR